MQSDLIKNPKKEMNEAISITIAKNKKPSKPSTNNEGRSKWGNPKAF